MKKNWSQNEVLLIIADYFDMLEHELGHQPYNKTEHRNRLLRMLTDRNNGSIEFKHQNISAVLADMGLPFIKGYKPRYNYQQLLEELVEQHLRRHQARVTKFFEDFAEEAIPERVLKDAFADSLEDAPEPMEKKRKVHTFNPVKINYLEKEQGNRTLGREGEEWVLKYERWRLAKAGKKTLIKKIEWVSQEKGDGAGYDILSKNVDGTDRYIEVKTTKLSKESPIYITATEMAFAEQYASSFYLYRIFQASEERKLFIRQGSYLNFCQLEPVAYKGVF